MNKLAFKKTQTLLALITLFVLFSSFYFEYVQGLQPCPLCLMQRLCVFVLLGLAGLSFATRKRAHFIILLQGLFAIAGLYFASRQLWLISLPPGKVPACMPGLDILIKYFPWQDVAKALFLGAADCAETSWSLLGISMPGWTALYFLFMAGVSLLLFMYTRPPKS
ncbi:disulfide bond formation protein B [Legionella waltersii]|uniref:Disulfide bond formation protein B n=1 Tax=Legionella waltersii TaxID=66969 RepID=A0A0W1ADW6_9GAMM|nr:disulfide bond formation protein B [Legionella waltersii]KTD79331.1 disulfide bond formation protein DsbB [Legionella waltersii]SNV13094.1 disulfide bond formation protein DsbB [Legionella waltersii]